MKKNSNLPHCKWCLKISLKFKWSFMQIFNVLFCKDFCINATIMITNVIVNFILNSAKILNLNYFLQKYKKTSKLKLHIYYFIDRSIGRSVMYWEICELFNFIFEINEFNCANTLAAVLAGDASILFDRIWIKKKILLKNMIIKLSFLNINKPKK